MADKEEYGIIESGFDKEFYQKEAWDRGLAIDDPIAHYLDSGWREGMDPVAWFSSGDYLKDHPDVRRAGCNPFVHYLKFGKKENRKITNSSFVSQKSDMPLEWTQQIRNIVEYFDNEFYRKELGGKELPEEELVIHYLREGRQNGLDPASWFSAFRYLKKYPDVARAGLDPFYHYIVFGKKEGRVIFPSTWKETPDGFRPNAWYRNDTEYRHYLHMAELYFDSSFYVKQLQNPDAVDCSFVEHYLREGWLDNLDPAPDFSTSGYLEANPDVRASGMNPFLHWLLKGIREKRKLGFVDPAKNDLKFWDGYERIRRYASTLATSGSRDNSHADFTIALAGLNLEKIARELKFANREANPGAPLVSIIIPCLNCDLYTAECLASIERLANKTYNYEIIIVDNASSDKFYGYLAQNPGLKYIRLEQNQGFGAANNTGVQQAAGDFILFLNNDTQLHPDSIGHLLACLLDDSTFKPGVVCGKVLNFNGKLQEAGTVISKDGIGHLIGLNADPALPRFNYRRKVESASALALLMPKSVFEAAGTFDPVFGTAYCEDTDLLFRIKSLGLDMVYEPKAVIAHHLSATSQKMANLDKNRLAAKNRDILITRWENRLADLNRIRTVAFYFPQYHANAANDHFWGKGYTDWRRVGQASANYRGHRQPRVPAELGYYDMHSPATLKAQSRLAKKYGINAFCFHFYWFSGTYVMEKPLQAMLASGEPDMPFCISWANENWTRRWDGGNQDVMLEQAYTEEEALDVIKAMTPYLRDRRYFKVNGKCLLLVYRIADLPNPARWIQVWRNYCKSNGLPDLFVAMEESFQFAGHPVDPASYGCDISVEYSPHGLELGDRLPVERLNMRWDGGAYSYEHVARAYMARPEPPFSRIRSVLAGWDNTPRYPDGSLVLAGTNPGMFQAWLEWTFQRTLEQNCGEERIVFLCSWNEWGEGSYLEPDMDYGRSFLQAVKNAHLAIEDGVGFYE